MDLNIYYIGAIAQADPGQKAFAKHAVSILEQYGNVLTKHIAFDDMGSFERAEEAKGVNIANRDFEWLANADVAVADLSSATTGGGLEVMYSLGVAGIPVLALYREDVHASKMITQLQHPLLHNETYRDSDSLAKKIDAFMESFIPRFSLYPNYFVYDSIDGAGKGAIHDMLMLWGVDNNRKTFNAIPYFKKTRQIPTWEEVNSMVPGCDLLLVCEPTFADVGIVVRNELISTAHDRDYSATTVAHGYSIDREILFKRLLDPALKAGVLVGSDRGVITSDHYQPAQANYFEGYSWEYFLGLVRGLPGNQLASSYVPGMILMPQVPVEVAMERLKNRLEKDDKALFETKDFQSIIAETYLGDRVKKAYSRRGSAITDLMVSKGETRPETIARAREVWEDYVKKNNMK